MARPKLKVKKLGRYWWIVSSDDGPWGPYDNKEEADEDCKGLTQFYIDDEWETEE